jgi:hypothetical protein
MSAETTTSSLAKAIRENSHALPGASSDFDPLSGQSELFIVPKLSVRVITFMRDLPTQFEQFLHFERGP